MFTDKFHPATMPSVHHIQHLKLKISNCFDSVDKNDNFDNDNGDIVMNDAYEEEKNI